MADLLHLAIAQLKPRKGDYAANLERLGSVLDRLAALEPRPDVLVLPETALTGYFLEGGVRDAAVTAGTLARDLAATYAASRARDRALDVVIGFYELWRDTLYNSAIYLRLGDASDGGARVLHIHRKNFLPTYGLFDEERFVERGHEIRAFDTPWGRAAMLVCEDAWHSLSGTIAALDDAQVIFLPAAAPARGVWPRDDAIPGPASVARWERLVRDIAEEQGVFVALANLAGSEGGKVFSGASMVAGPGGDVRLRAPVFDEALATITIDLGDLARARADSPLLADLRTQLPHLRRMLAEADEARVRRAHPEFDPADEHMPDEAISPGRDAAPPSEAAASSDGGADDDEPTGLTIVRAADREHGIPPTLAIDAPLVERWLLGFIRDEMGRRGFTKAVVGLSGGVDSAVTTVLAARALGSDNVIAVRMPYRTSSPESLAHAQLVVDQLDVESRTIDISAAVDGYLANEPDADAARRGNVMARTRMIALFDLSARYRALALGTGNKSERLLGYFTWHADDSPPINPLGDLYKTQVWALARHLGVPDVIIDKPASADLVAGQTDEGDFGVRYERADLILDWLLSGHTPADLVAHGFDANEVALVRRRLENTHWKRRLPTVAMLSPTAIGESYLRPVDY
jgi:NAD+ synthetase